MCIYSPWESSHYFVSYHPSQPGLCWRIQSLNNSLSHIRVCGTVFISVYIRQHLYRRAIPLLSWDFPCRNFFSQSSLQTHFPSQYQKPFLIWFVSLWSKNSSSRDIWQRLLVPNAESMQSDTTLWTTLHTQKVFIRFLQLFFEQLFFEPFLPLQECLIREFKHHKSSFLQEMLNVLSVVQ